MRSSQKKRRSEIIDHHSDLLEDNTPRHENVAIYSTRQTQLENSVRAAKRREGVREGENLSTTRATLLIMGIV